MYDLGVIKARVLHTAGIGESSLDDLIGRQLLEASNPTVGLAAHNGQVDVRITAKADTLDDADALIEIVESQLRTSVGRYVYGSDADTLEDVVKATLAQHHATIGVLDAGLNTVLPSLLGSSVVHSEIYDTPEILRSKLGMPDESLRQLTERAAAEIAGREDVSIVIAVVSRPDVEESSDAAEGTAVTVRMGDTVKTRVYGFGAKSDLVRTWIKTWALAQTWWLLRDSQQ